MSITVTINYEAYIDELINTDNNFSFLKDKILPTESSMKWARDNKEEIRSNVIFIGKTGYGKSTTLNNIINKNVFHTDDVVSCTKDLYEVSYKLRDDRPHYLSLADLPGVGENIEADKKYLEWYREFFEYSDVVVYILRCDQRDFSIDEDLFKKLFPTPKDKEKVILALNYADKIEPINRVSPFVPSEEQNINMQIKIKEVARIFNVQQSQIVCYSATEKYNIKQLTRTISKKLKENINSKIVKTSLGVDQEAKEQVVLEKGAEEIGHMLAKTMSELAKSISSWHKLMY